MAIKTRDEILAAIRNIVSDDASDELLELIEDVTDTIDDLNNNNDNSWKSRYEENDRAWRERYRDRFFNVGSDESNSENEEEETKKPLSYDDLFEVKE